MMGEKNREVQSHLSTEVYLKKSVNMLDCYWQCSVGRRTQTPLTTNVIILHTKVR